MTEKENGPYLSSQEQLVLAAKVNRLCEAEPETFDPHTQIQDARSIVVALNDRLGNSSNATFKLNVKKESESKSVAAATDLGTVNTNFDEEETKTYQLGRVNEYRIGGYVATKRQAENSTVLHFEPFWDRGWVTDIFSRYQPTTSIRYNEKSLELLHIQKNFPTFLKLPFLLIVRYKGVLLWERQTD